MDSKKVGKAQLIPALDEISHAPNITRADKSLSVSDLDIIELLYLYWGEQNHPNKFKYILVTI